MISKYILLISLFSHNIVYSINMYFGRPYIPNYYSIQKNNVFQTLPISFGTFDNSSNVYKKQDVQLNQGNRLSQLPEFVKHNNKENNIYQRTYEDKRLEPQSEYSIKHHLWNIHAQQAAYQLHQLAKQKQYQKHLLMKQKEIKKHHDHKEKLKKEKELTQRLKLLQRIYYENLLHRELDENEHELHKKIAHET
ncbi:uncharacterized protein LOC112601454 [Melanaphis sacchari]|uniref:uncharacterized protein LOC112601454 n=1 Tax=Melanaphis sacchari TaxID=742174 RepID=UPI000DC134B3|nr:uncharacterized protein LOC112601454 [Melanaphis sacchari]